MAIPESFSQHRKYIAENPLKAGLIDSSEKFPYCFAYVAARNRQGLNTVLKK
jgi:hypothetical protein